MGQAYLTEEHTFHTLVSFLQTDLMRGMMAGNLPRCSHNCREYFLTNGEYVRRLGEL